jgi:hypothetical protein
MAGFGARYSAQFSNPALDQYFFRWIISNISSLNKGARHPLRV